MPKVAAKVEPLQRGGELPYRTRCREEKGFEVGGGRIPENHR